MSEFDASQPRSPIQRLLIFHLNLAEKCLGGKSLGEDASLQELGESILYYYREDAGEHGNGQKEGDDVPSEEAVQFLGLCTALLTLPSSLGDPALKYDKTNEIYFGNSTLVFITLEASQELIAVAQISRLYQNGNKSDSGGGNPLAVRSSIERCHNLFCMLHGGGTLHRLASGMEQKKNSVDTCPYPGMATLFRKQKELRKAVGQMARAQADNQSSVEIGNMREEINILRSSLPIRSIRCDLIAHYTQYLGDLSIVVGRNGGAARCIVETVPLPIPQDSGSHVTESLPPNGNSYMYVALGLAMRKMLREFQPCDGTIPSLLGISVFFHGQLLFTHLSKGETVHSTAEGENLTDATLPKQVACLIMWYMASYSIKMSQLDQTKNATNQAGAVPHLGLNGLSISLKPLADEAASNYKGIGDRSDFQQDSDVLRFLRPPPLFMVSSSNHSYSFKVPNHGHIWAPKIHLPVIVSNGKTSERRHLETRAIASQKDGFGFLFFLKDNFTNEIEPVSLPSSFFERLQEIISEIDLNDKALNAPTTQDAPYPQSESGQEIVHINRDQNMLTLISDRKQAVFREKMKPTLSKNPKRRFLGFGPRATEKKTNATQHHPTGTSEWSALGLDCRHLLASHLHLDTVLAFDDMMAEVAKTKRKVWKQDEEANKLIELCTCMPLGWMYAFADNEMELYAFFDSSIYVTVADVQGAALKLQERFFGRWTDKSVPT